MAVIAPVIVLLFAAVLAAPAAWLAHRRGRSVVIWGALGMVLPVVGILLLFVVGKPKAATA